MCVCVCLKRENKEMDRKYQSDWKCEKKRQSKWRRRGREHVINLLGGGFEAGVCISARVIYPAGCARQCKLQVADSKATQTIRDCKYEPDKYVLSLMFLVSCVECIRQKMIHCNMLFSLLSINSSEGDTTTVNDLRP